MSTRIDEAEPQPPPLPDESDEEVELRIGLDQRRGQDSETETDICSDENENEEEEEEAVILDRAGVPLVRFDSNGVPHPCQKWFLVEQRNEKYERRRVRVRRFWAAEGSRYVDFPFNDKRCGLPEALAFACQLKRELDSMISHGVPKDSPLLAQRASEIKNAFGAYAKKRQRENRLENPAPKKTRREPQQKQEQQKKPEKRTPPKWKRKRMTRDDLSEDLSSDASDASSDDSEDDDWVPH
jgi:hypothetical protein